MKYFLTAIIIFFNNFIIVYGLNIEENLSQLSQNLQKIQQEQNNRKPLDQIYPIGSIYITATNTNPASTLGGTWQAYAQGRTLIGVDSSSYKSAELTGGKSIKSITTSNMTAHNHNISISGKVSSTFKGTSTSTSSNGNHIHTFMGVLVQVEGTTYSLSETGNGFGGRVVTFTTTRDNTSSNGSHNHTVTPAGTVTSTFKGNTSSTTSIGSNSSLNFQNPYITVYIWKRIS